jgi:hypothetical protein
VSWKQAVRLKSMDGAMGAADVDPPPSRREAQQVLLCCYMCRADADLPV